MKLTGKKLLLLLLYAPSHGVRFNSPIAGRTRLMKIVFLFEEEFLERFRQDQTVEEFDLPTYYPWKYGPFSAQLLNDLEFLVNRGYISLVRCEDASAEELDEISYWLDEYGDTVVGEYVQESFSLTADKGCERAKGYWEELSENQRHVLVELKERFVSASLDRILEYVYKTYGEYTDESVIRDRYL